MVMAIFIDGTRLCGSLVSLLQKGSKEHECQVSCRRSQVKACLESADFDGYIKSTVHGITNSSMLTLSMT